MLDELKAIDVTVIEELRTLKAEQETLHERLEAMEAKRDEVSQVVFDRVHGDYQTRYDALEDTARPLKQRARAEFATLTDLLQRMTDAVEAARLATEELEFRNELGEFEKADFEKRMDEAKKTLERCETELGEGEALRERFVSAVRSEDELLSGDDEELAETEAPEPEPEAEPADEGPDADDDQKEAADASEPEDGPGDEAGEETELELELDDDRTPSDKDEKAEATYVGELPDVEPPPIPAPDDAATTEDAATPSSMEDIPTGRMPVMEAGGPPPMPGDDPPSPPSPPPVPEDEEPGDGEATAMFAMARLVAPASDGTEQEFPLNPTETTIGRAPGNDIRINDGAVSRQHAKIVMGDHGYTLLDLGSENGVYVNRERVKEQMLRDGDVVEIGPGTRTYIFRG